MKRWNRSDSEIASDYGLSVNCTLTVPALASLSWLRAVKQSVVRLFIFFVSLVFVLSFTTKTEKSVFGKTSIKSNRSTLHFYYITKFLLYNLFPINAANRKKWKDRNIHVHAHPTQKHNSIHAVYHCMFSKPSASRTVCGPKQFRYSSLFAITKMLRVTLSTHASGKGAFVPDNVTASKPCSNEKSAQRDANTAR